MNAERRVSLLHKAVEPRGNSKSDWEIVCDFAKAYGCGDHFQFRSANEIWDEIREVWPGSYGITYKRLERGGLQWGCPDEDHPGTEILHVDSFTKSVRAALQRIPFEPTPERVSGEFPFLLSTGRTLFQFNAGTMTERTPNLKLRPSDRLEMSEGDAVRLGVADGEIVELASAYGEAKLPVHINNAVRTGELFTTFHTPEIFLNNVLGPVRDRIVKAPEFKVTAVNVRKID